MGKTWAKTTWYGWEGKYDVPPTVREIVKAICIDYDRRKRAITYHDVSGETLEQYISLNGIIEQALEDVEPGIRDDFFKDIQKGKGYNKSSVAVYVYKNGYYFRRAKLIHDIALSLKLISDKAAEQTH